MTDLVGGLSQTLRIIPALIPPWSFTGQLCKHVTVETSVGILCGDEGIHYMYPVYCIYHSAGQGSAGSVGCRTHIINNKVLRSNCCDPRPVFINHAQGLAT